MLNAEGDKKENLNEVGEKRMLELGQLNKGEIIIEKVRDAVNEMKI